MPFTIDDLSGLRILLQEELRTEITPLQSELREFRNDVLQSFDALFQRDEKREQEYLALRKQFSSLEKKLSP